jgi:hypothetical protein
MVADEYWAGYRRAQSITSIFYTNITNFHNLTVYLRRGGGQLPLSPPSHWILGGYNTFLAVAPLS